jgi:predicted dehydrogenase
VERTDGNYREHIDILYMVTDQGWRLTGEERDGQLSIRASRHGRDEWITPQPLPGTRYDRFVEAIESDAPNPRDLPDVDEAAEDVRLIRAFDGKRFGRIERSG